MEEEIFVANSKGDVKALGMKINCAPADLHIYVNGVHACTLLRKLSFFPVSMPYVWQGCFVLVIAD